MQYQLTSYRITAVLTATSALASYLARGATHAALWGVVAFREFRGAPWTAWLALVLMFAAYASAVVVLALSSGKM